MEPLDEEPSDSQLIYPVAPMCFNLWLPDNLTGTEKIMRTGVVKL